MGKELGETALAATGWRGVEHPNLPGHRPNRRRAGAVQAGENFVRLSYTLPLVIISTMQK